MEIGYKVGGQCIYNIQPATKPNNMEQAIKRIEALIRENETVKNNAMKIITSRLDNQRARAMWHDAKIENEAYQNAINIIKEVSNGI